jgi:NADH-quinone oxidoreductase subunit C/D
MHVIDELKHAFPESIFAVQPTRDAIPTAWCSRDDLLDIVWFLKHQVQDPYSMLYDLTAIDERTRTNRPSPVSTDFTVVYHLLSMLRNEDVRLKVALESDHPAVQSITSIFRSADWYEREAYDMFGIKFDGHPNLRRILMPQTWQGHPLRKEHPARATEMGPYQLPETSVIVKRKRWSLNPRNGVYRPLPMIVKPCT